MKWVDRDSLQNYNLVDDFMDLLEVVDSDYYSEFIYERNKPSNRSEVRLY